MPEGELVATIVGTVISALVFAWAMVTRIDGIAKDINTRVDASSHELNDRMDRVTSEERLARHNLRTEMHVNLQDELNDLRDRETKPLAERVKLIEDQLRPWGRGDC